VITLLAPTLRSLRLFMQYRLQTCIASVSFSWRWTCCKMQCFSRQSVCVVTVLELVQYMRSNFSKENIASIFRAKLGAMWFIKCSWIYSRGAGSMSQRNAGIHLSNHLMPYLTSAQYNSHLHENLKSTCTWSAGFVMCRSRHHWQVKVPSLVL